MRKPNAVRRLVDVRIVTLVLAIGGIGAPCDAGGPCKLDPGAYETTTIRIDNLSTEKTFSATRPHDRLLHGWDHETLGDVDLLSSAADLYDLHITGGWPRELLTLSRSPIIPDYCDPNEVQNCFVVLTLPTSVPWRPGYDRVKYYRLPGLATFLPMSDYNRALVRGEVRAARLIDHGACYYTRSFSSIFALVSEGFWNTWRTEGWRRHDRIGMPEANFSASFMRDIGAISLAGNHDGFSMYLRLNYHHLEGFPVPFWPVPLPPLSVDFASDIWQTYQIGFADGLPTLETVYSLGYDHRNPTADFFNALVGGVGAVDLVQKGLRDTLPTEFRASLVASTTFPIEQGSIKARCQPAACSATGQTASNCERDGKQFLETGMKNKGVSAEEAKRVVDGLTSDQFGCQVAPDAALFDKPEQKGICTIRVKFKRANVLPTALELVWHDQYEKPSPSEVIASVFGAADQKPYCPDQGPLMTQGAADVPVSRYSYPDQDLPWECRRRTCDAKCFGYNAGPSLGWQCVNKQFEADTAGICPGAPCAGPKKHWSCTDRCGYHNDAYKKTPVTDRDELFYECCDPAAPRAAELGLHHPSFCCDKAYAKSASGTALDSSRCHDPTITDGVLYPTPPTPVWPL